MSEHAEEPGVVFNGQYAKALEALLARLTTDAVQRLAQEGIVFVKTEAFSSGAWSGLQLTGWIALRAREEVDANRLGLDADSLTRANAAAEALEAAYFTRRRLEAGAPDLKQSWPNFLAELVYLGASLGVADLLLVQHGDGLFQDAAKVRRDRATRQEAIARVNASRTSWHANALELCRSVCGLRPGISDDELASQVVEKIADAPQHTQVLRTIGEWRRKEELPRRVKKPAAQYRKAPSRYRSA